MKIPFLDLEIKKISKDSIEEVSTPPVKEEESYKVEREELAPAPIIVQEPLPVKAGRQTQPEGISLLGILQEELAVVDPDFDLKLISVIEHLAKYNGDLSYAIDNIVQLGNTPYTIFFDDSVTDEQSKEMTAYLIAKQDSWYQFSGGLNNLINDLLAQAAINGAVSGEAVPQKDLKGIEKTVLVAPKNIKFVYDKNKEKYDPYQVVNNLVGYSLGTSGMKKLNTTTYKYYALRRFSERPHGIPPFLSALDSIAIERDMICNIKTIIKKFGILGFLSVLITPPPRRGDDKMMKKEAEGLILEAREEMQKGVDSGFVIGFKNQHEFKMEDTNTNVTGATELFNLNTQIKMAGLKQDPLMLGRNYSTTETIGRVILAKLSTQIVNYQKLAASFLKDVKMLDLRMAGFKFGNMWIEFEKPLLGDAVRDEDAFSKKIKNYDDLYKQGVISQAQRAQAVGWEKPDQEEPRMPVNPMENVADGKDTDPTNPKSTDVKTTSKKLPVKLLILEAENTLNSHLPLFDYGHGPESYTLEDHMEFLKGYSFGKDSTGRYMDGYYRDTRKMYRTASKKVSKMIASDLSELSKGASIEEVQDRVIGTLYSKWRTTFTLPQRKIIKKWVENAYKHFRQDKSVFGGVDKIIDRDGKETNIPKSTFNQIDLKTIEYYKKSDELYLGKFITDPDTKKKITEFIKDEYLGENLPIGKSPGSIAKFVEAFPEVLKGEEWKIQRVVNTTVNKMRNTASINYMDQAEIERFKVIGINDRLQCKYCAHMQGREFSIKTAKSRADSLASSDPEFVKEVSPFINSIYKKGDDIAKDKISDEALQLSGVDMPPYHSSCRDIVIAVL